jgi:hypothetical protein
LQPLLPSGVAAGDRARATMAAARAARAPKPAVAPVSRPLNWLTGIAAGRTSA